MESKEVGGCYVYVLEFLVARVFSQREGEVGVVDEPISSVLSKSACQSLTTWASYIGWPYN